MCATPRSRGAILALLIALLAAKPARGQLSEEAQDQIKQEAASLASQPARVVLKPQAQGVVHGTSTQLGVLLVDANNRPVRANQDEQVQLDLVLPSGAKSTQTVVIPKGQTSGTAQISTTEQGLASVSAWPTAKNIRPAKTEILVLPSAASTGKANQKPTGSSAKPNSEVDPLKRFPRYDLNEHAVAGLYEVKWRPRHAVTTGDDTSGSSSEKKDTRPKLYISVDNAASDYIANGSEPVVISAYFVSPNGAPAPKDTKIWFTFSRGSLNPGALEIPKGSYSGTTQLTSNWPGDAHVSFVSSSPAYSAEGQTSFDVQFVPLGVVLYGPAQLSVIDNVPVLVVFVDDQEAIAPGRDWPISLHTERSKLSLTPVNLTVKGDSPLGSAWLVPTSVGTDTIDAVAADYPTASLNVVITWKLILALCLAGGAVGGIAAYQQFRGSWFWRIFLGLTGGALLSWLYVFLALPAIVAGNTVANIAHNTISVLFVSILGGYMGLRALDFAAKKFGWLNQESGGAT
jgi:hypothetical protein